MIPVVDVTRIIGWVKTAGADVVKFLALRSLILGVVTILVPWAIVKGWVLILEQVTAFATNQFASSSGDLWSGNLIQLTGLGAWLATQLKFVECFSVMATAMSYTFILSFIRR